MAHATNTSTRAGTEPAGRPPAMPGASSRSSFSGNIKQSARLPSRVSSNSNKGPERAGPVYVSLSPAKAQRNRLVIPGSSTRADSTQHAAALDAIGFAEIIPQPAPLSVLQAQRALLKEGMRDYLISVLVTRPEGPFNIRDSLLCKRKLMEYAERWDSIHKLYTTHLRLNRGFSTERRKEFYTNPFNFAARYAEMYHDTCLYHDLEELATGRQKWEDLLVVMHWLLSQLTCTCWKCKQTIIPGYCVLRCKTCKSCKEEPRRPVTAGRELQQLLQKYRGDMTIR